MRSDLFKHALKDYPSLAAYWTGKAIKGGTFEAKQAARCFWSMSLQYDGEIASHNALAAAGIECPDWLADCPPSGELIKRQRRSVRVVSERR